MPAHRVVTVDADRQPLFTAAYLRLAGDEAAFIETCTSHSTPRLLAALERAGRRPEDVRTIVVTHAHLDHAAGASALARACPRATVLAHPRTVKHLVDPSKLIAGAKAVYGEARFAHLYGDVQPIPAERVRALADGESFELGGATLTAWHTAGHAWHHLVVHDPAVECAYTGDTFGLVYPAVQQHGRFALASTSPTGFNAAEARKSVERVLSLGVRQVCPTHFGPWSEVTAIGAQVRRFVDRAEQWLAEAVASGLPAPALQARLEAKWRRAILDEAPRFGEAELAALALDVELNAQGLAAVAVESRAKPA